MIFIILEAPAQAIEVEQFSHRSIPIFEFIKPAKTAGVEVVYPSVKEHSIPCPVKILPTKAWRQSSNVPTQHRVPSVWRRDRWLSIDSKHR